MQKKPQNTKMERRLQEEFSKLRGVVIERVRKVEMGNYWWFYCRWISFYKTNFYKYLT